MFESLTQNITLDFNNFSVGLALFIFIAYFIIDALFAYYTLSITGYHAITAATSGFLIYFLLAFGVINYVENYLYVFPLAFGSWFGTYFMVKKEKRQETSFT
jgi:hypothetical protein